MAKINSKKDAGSDEDPKSKRPSKRPRNLEGPPWYQQPSFFMKRFYSQPSYSKEYWQNLSLEEKRKLYSCRDKFLQLKDIKSWPEYASENRIPHFKGETEIHINPTLNKKVSLWSGDITRLEIDAIVHAANSSLMGGDEGEVVDGAIHSAAGTSLREECADLGGCDVGDAKLSTGHRLPAKYIIHTVGPRNEDDSSLRSCYQSCLRIVAEKNFKSVAFCCIATGVYGFPNRRAADIALCTVREWLDTEDNADKINRIIFTTFLEKDMTIYEELLQFYFPLERSGAGSDPKNRRDIVTESKTSEDTIPIKPSLQIHAVAPVMTSKGEWVVGDTLDTKGLNNEDYKSKYQQQLQVCLEENQRPGKGDIADTEQTIQALRRTLQEKENEKVRDAQRFLQQLEQKEREEAGKEEEIQRYRHLLQEKERQNTEIEKEKEKDLKRELDEIKQQVRELHVLIYKQKTTESTSNDDSDTSKGSQVYDPEQVKKVFKKYYADLSDLLAVPDNMSAIGIRLYSKDLIPEETFDNISTSNKSGRDKANSLLHALRAIISIEPQSLKTLIEVLRRNKAFKAIADKMDEDVSSHI